MCVRVAECAVCAATCRNENYLKWFISQQFSLGDQLQCRFSLPPLPPSLPLSVLPCTNSLLLIFVQNMRNAALRCLPAWHGVASSTCGISCFSAAIHVSYEIIIYAVSLRTQPAGSAAAVPPVDWPRRLPLSTRSSPLPQLPLPAICFSLSQCRKKRQQNVATFGVCVCSPCALFRGDCCITFAEIWL